MSNNFDYRIKNIFFYISLMSLCFFMQIYPSNFPQNMLIKKPIVPMFPGPDVSKRMDTQLLYGERVIALEEKAGKLKIQALEEQFIGLSSGRLEGFEGWIDANSVQACDRFPEYTSIVQNRWARVYKEPNTTSDVICELSFGTLLDTIRDNKTDITEWIKVGLVHEKNHEYGFVQASNIYDLSHVKNIHSIRKRLITLAQLFLETKYRVGGRSAHHVNCSGFINLLYRASGLLIPLKAHDQYLMSRSIDASQVEPGDLVFIHQPAKRKRMAHVIMYLGDNLFIEAGNNVCIITADKLFHGLSGSSGSSGSWRTLKNGAQRKKSTVYFGSFLQDQEYVDYMQRDLLELSYLDSDNNWRCTRPSVPQ